MKDIVTVTISTCNKELSDRVNSHFLHERIFEWEGGCYVVTEFVNLTPATIGNGCEFTMIRVRPPGSTELNSQYASDCES